MQDILEAARAAKTSGDFAAVIGDLDAALAEADAKRQRLTDEVEGVIFEDGNLSKARKALVDCAAEVDTLTAARNGAVKRRAQAEDAEEAVRIEDRIAQANETAEKLTAEAAVYHAALEAARKAHAAMDKLSMKLKELNSGLEFDRRVSSSRAMDASRIRMPEQFTGLSRPGVRIDQLLIDLGTPGKTIPVVQRAQPNIGLAGLPPSSVPQAGVA